MNPILGNWNNRGQAEPIRLLLHYTGTPFVDKRYTVTEEFGIRQLEEWLNDEFNLDLEFPDLPYYIDEEVNLTQSIAILRYLGRKHGLVPPTTAEQELARADLLEQKCVDFFDELRTLACSKDFTADKVEYLKRFPERIKGFENVLGNHSWLLGQKIMYVDFFFFEILDRHRYVDPNFTDSFPNVKAYMDRFESLANVAKYRKSEEFLSIKSRHLSLGSSCNAQHKNVQYIWLNTK